jgi:chaperonin GroEL
MKAILFSEDARNKIVAGVKKITRAVKVTLGPAGRNVLISRALMDSYGTHHYPVHVTKDGITVARAFELEDQLEYTGAKLIKEAAQKTVEQAGDSTTTTCVLAEAIIDKGMLAVANGHNPVYVKRGMDNAVAAVVKRMKEISIPVSGDNTRIQQVATVTTIQRSER